MTTPAHLVHHHGYDRAYAERLNPVAREAEHARLHEDETAKHLDHEHETNAPKTQPMPQSIKSAPWGYKR